MKYSFACFPKEKTDAYSATVIWKDYIEIETSQ